MTICSCKPAVPNQSGPTSNCAQPPSRRAQRHCKCVTLFICICLVLLITNCVQRIKKVSSLKLCIALRVGTSQSVHPMQRQQSLVTLNLNWLQTCHVAHSRAFPAGSFESWKMPCWWPDWPYYHCCPPVLAISKSILRTETLQHSPQKHCKMPVMCLSAFHVRTTFWGHVGPSLQNLRGCKQYQAVFMSMLGSLFRKMVRTCVSYQRCQSSFEWSHPFSTFGADLSIPHPTCCFWTQRNCWYGCLHMCARTKS